LKRIKANFIEKGKIRAAKQTRRKFPSPTQAHGGLKKRKINASGLVEPKTQTKS
jgi:hypothetical protein